MLDAELAGVVEQQAAGSLYSILNLCYIVDRSVKVRGVLRFLGGGVIKIRAEIGDVFIHYKAAGALIIVPLEIYSIVEVAFSLTVTSYFSLRTLSK